jgi:ribosomal protein S18 acetylase RimI-like enzyme
VTTGRHRTPAPPPPKRGYACLARAASHTLGRVPATLHLAELDPGRFLARLETLTGIYAAAMGVPAAQLPGRKAIMERHAGYPGFRAVAATAAPDDSAAPGDPGGSGDPAKMRLAGFAYGFHGADGQWWHDLVRGALAQRYGPKLADRWLGDSFEIAEVHVLPAHQGQGAGLAMLRQLTAGLREPAAVLSTLDAETRARRLYRSLGFTDLLARFTFPGGGPAYAIMGAALPLAA